jgi:1-acyl-sn-glycerol-3-phosphate acyltransferase
MKAVFQGLFRLLSDVCIHGQENVPRRQAYIVVINHISLYDPPFALAFWPEMLEAMGASDIWRRPGQKWLARMYHGIPVHRGEYDREVFDKALAVLASNRPLLLAPEGGRSHATSMRQAKPGVAFLVEQAGVPVIPAGIFGTTDDFWHRARSGHRPRLEMCIGKPLQLPPVDGKGAERRLARQRNADLVMAHVASLLPPEYRGYYTDEVIFQQPLQD